MRILVVDDHEVVRRGVAALLSSQPNFTICGEAIDGIDAIEKAKQLRPDVVVMDISMPKLNGLEATRKIRSVIPGTEVLVLSQHDAAAMVQQAFRAGARGYVMKSSIARDLVTAVLKVAAHEVFAPNGDGGNGHVDSKEILQRSAALERELRESEERFRLTFEQAAVGIAHVAEDGRWLRVNQKLCDILGYTQDELKKLTFQDITYPDDLREDIAQVELMCSGGIDQYSMEKRYIRKDGHLLWTNLTVGAVRDDQRKVKYFVSVVEDISSRKEAEFKLIDAQRQTRTTAEHLEFITNTMAAAVSRCSRAFRYVWVNQRYADWIQRPLNEIMGEPIRSILGQNAFERLRPYFERVLSGETVSYEEQVVLPRIGERWLSATYTPTFDTAGTPDGWVAVVRDITKQRIMQAALLENEHRFQQIIQALPAAIYATDLEGRITHFNSATVEFAGRPPQLASDRWTPAWKLFRADGSALPPDECPMAVTVKEGRVVEGVEIIAERPDGTRRWYMPYPRLLTDSTGNTIGAINMLVDITEQKQAFQASSLLATIVDFSDDAVVSKNLEGVITTWNKGAERLFGYNAAEAIGKSITLIIPPNRFEEEENILNRLRSGERIEHFETVRMRKDGALLDISLTVSPVKDERGKVVGASKVARDITDRKRTEKVLATGVRQIRALLQLADQLNRAVSLDEVYRASLDAILTASQCDRGSILLFDDSGVMKFVSWRGLSERYRSAVEGHSPWMANETNPIPIFVADIERSDLSEFLKQVLEDENIRALAFFPLVVNGRVVGKFMTYFNSPHEFSKEELEINLAIARQLAVGIDRKRAEDALRKSEEHFRTIVEATPECVKVVAADGTLLHMNSSGLQMVGADSAEMVIGKSVYDLIASEDRDRFRTFNEHVCSGKRGSLEFDIVGLKGLRCHMETHGTPFQNPDGTLVHLALTRDVTERKLAEEQLKESQERYRGLAESLETEVRARTVELEQRNSEVLRQSAELRELSTRLMNAQDQERQRLARELHDSAGQLVTALGITLANIGEYGENDTRIAKEVQDSEQLVQQLNKEIRTMSYLLHPPLLDENGLVEAVRWYVQGLQERSGLEIEMDLSGDEFGRLPHEMELALFRIVQECLTNVHRHSGSETARIRIERAADSIGVEIEDQGKGIPAEKLDGDNNIRSGVGIAGIQERVRHFHGTVRIESSARGTKVSVRIPALPTNVRESDGEIQERAAV